MSTFPTLPTLAALPDLTPKPIRRLAVDSMVAENRARTPVSAIEERAQPRLSISELNDLDMEDIRKRWGLDKIDTRGPVTKFLDLIDLPRNAISNVVFQGAAKRKAAMGDTATFGLPRVNFSDALDEMGVDNRVIRGVLGFVGDVALDPLTYVGPAGWGAKVATKAGRSAEFVGAGKKAFEEGIQAAHAGRQAADPLVARYLKAHGAVDGKSAAEAIYGGVRTKTNKALGYLGMDAQSGSPSKLAGDVWDIITPTTEASRVEQIQSAKELFKKYGRPHAKGVRVVKDKAAKGGFRLTTDTSVAAGSGVAHIPFTDISLTVPAFTRGAKTGAALSKIAANPISKFSDSPIVNDLHDMQRTAAAINYEDLKYEINPTTDTFYTPQDVTHMQARAYQQISDRAAGVQQIKDATPSDILHAEKIARVYQGAADIARIKSEEAQKNLAELTTLQQGAKKSIELKTAEKVAEAREANTAANREVIAARAAALEKLREENVVIEQMRLDVEAEIESIVREQKANGLKPSPMTVRQIVMKDRGLTADDLKLKTTREEDFPIKSFDEDAARRQAATEVHAAYIANAPNELLRKAASLTDQDLQVMKTEADGLRGQYRAAQKIASVSMSPVINALGDGGDSAAIARAALGLGEDDVGSSIIGTMADAANSIWDQNSGALGKSAASTLTDFARFARNTLGWSESTIKSYQRAYLKSISMHTNQAFQEVQNATVKAVKALGLTRKQESEAYKFLESMQWIRDKDPNTVAAYDVAAQDLLQSMQTGLLRDKKIYAALRDIATQQSDALNKIKGYSLIDTYAHRVLTAEAQKRIGFNMENFGGIRGAKNTRGGNPLQAAPGAGLLERFVSPRSAVERVWLDADGNEHRFLESAMTYERYFNDPEGQKAFANLGPNDRKHVEASLAEYRLFQELPIEEQLAAETRHLSGAEINRRVRDEGLFDSLLRGEQLTGDFFETNAAIQWSNYWGAVERAENRKSLQELLNHYMVPIHKEAIADFKQGGEFVTRDGIKGRMFKENNNFYVQIGSQRYRQPKTKLFEDVSNYSDLDPTREAMPGFVPEEIADLIDDAANVFKDEGKMGMIMSIANEASALWKVATLTHPSWTINDVLGNLFLAAANGVNVVKMGKHLRTAFKMTLASAKGDRAALDNLIVEVNGVPRKASELVYGPGREFMGGHQAGEATSHLNAAGHEIIGERVRTRDIIKGLVHGDTGPAKQAWSDSVANATARSQTADTLMGQTTVGQKIGMGYSLAVDEGLYNRVWKPYAHLNGVANDWIKNAAFLAMMDSGHDAASAAKFVSDRMLDMSVLTGFDRTARKFVPFYNWIKASGVNGMRRLIDNPKFFSVVPHLRDAIEEATLGEDKLPQNARPSWLRDQLALQIGTDPDNRRALTLTNSLPTEAATYAVSFLLSPLLGAGALQDSLAYATNSLTLTNSLPTEAATYAVSFLLSPLLGAGALQDALAYATNSLTPVAKVPLELGARREFFTKRTISADGGDVTPGEYLMQQVRPFRELGIGQIRQGPLLRAAGEGVVPGVARAALGGRYQPIDDERRAFQLNREYSERIDALRKRINVATRENKPSLKERVQMLQLFQQMQTLGLKTPVWAQQQVGQAASQPP